jgi:hypothetical protein
MNKKIILMMLALSSTLVLKAQTEKGNQLLGGYVGFSTSSGNDVSGNSASITTTDTKFTRYNVGPNYSYFIAKNLDLGLALSYDHQKSTSTDAINNQYFESKYQSATGMVYLRKYILYENKIGIRTGPYASYSYGWQNTNNSTLISNGSGTTLQKDWSYGAGVGLDIVYFPVKKLGLSSAIGGLSYGHGKDRSNSYGNISNTDSNTFGFSLASTVNFSIFYVFGK